MEDIFSMWSVTRCYKQGSKSVDSSVRESVKRGSEPKAQEFSLLEPLLRNG
jgi:hypothetical protein